MQDRALDGRTGEPVVPNGSLGFRYTAPGTGRWNLDLDGVAPQLTLHGGDEAVEVLLPRFDAFDGRVGCCVARRAGAPRRPASWSPRCSTCCSPSTACTATGLPGTWPAGYDDAAEPYTPAWQESITSVPAAQAVRVAREFAANAEESKAAP